VLELLAAYPRAVGPRFDEMLGPGGRPREHWASLIEMLERAEPARMRDRIATIEREIRDSGLSSNRYADPQGAERPWALDALPMIIPPDEWASIEVAVAQRARLLDAMLGDFYGPQRLLADGTLPPRLVLGHSAFQRAACGTLPTGRPSLFVYAADLARSPDGRWWVVADRTQALGEFLRARLGNRADDVDQFFTAHADAIVPHRQRVRFLVRLNAHLKLGAFRQ
jgi:uncharacterized circularly permuted ATP-grasp superfamily protein